MKHLDKHGFPMNKNDIALYAVQRLGAKHIQSAIIGGVTIVPSLEFFVDFVIELFAELFVFVELFVEPFVERVKDLLSPEQRPGRHA
mmetsp:Transcript_7741/g.10357  ORF Transcript_7741/g.10357 Transcript_7741/m.10357 type:complete len:87 (+) Transcript_7741:282-542(+)